MANHSVDVNDTNAEQQTPNEQVNSKVKMEELHHYAAKLGQSSGPSAEYTATQSTQDGSSYEFEDVSDVYY